MKKTYTILLYAMCVLALAWSLPWLYDLVLPEAVSDPYVAFSPVSQRMIVTQRDGDRQNIFSLDSAGNPESAMLTKEQRDSLLPQTFYTQLMARQAMPDSLGGEEMSVANLRQGQWVFTSSPRDVNKVFPRLYPIMESMPVRFELEDPKEVFRLDGKVEFIDMATNIPNQTRSQRFTDAFRENGFKYPVRSHSANITSRKGYDEGYLLADAAGDVFHVKMQAGRPYMAKVVLPDSVEAEHVFILENPDHRLIGLMTDTRHHLYAIERDGYKAVRLSVGDVNPATDRIVIVKDLFNWVVKVSNSDGARWTALDSRDYTPRARYLTEYPESMTQKVAGWIFPFVFSVTSLDDCHVQPRITDLSWHALALNAVFALVVVVMMRRRKGTSIAIYCAAALLFGIYFFIPFLLITSRH
ncbi:MAG: DUF4857 domain-containing protein [Muribaculaceae bacterium]|nr:DUF4857 domain-containing protein [Muribaculaceae bacterium]